ncbi:VanW family protein [Dysgonomonas macrotermitis]|uniref:Vancomycin resistance protein VanW n=1 Tax=Dysgonomonas macrotermitis TaxID=1346286 RepID=A0A1M4T066_9BACT|nr:VanW family protein [Dysgonomonas macrotermitis]SHE37851.1 vancomycin resistance protein VanW [Dysgonomonas macrotermitis]
MDFREVRKPEHRGKLRSFLGKEYFILKRKLYWLQHLSRYSYINKENDSCQHSLIKHRSVLLRPLKDVDMYLQHNKITNLRLAIEKLNGTIIEPGKMFSIWKQVGRPSRRKGYLEGLALHNGQILTDIGGGLCQLGNLLYWMALHSDLKVTERWRHSFDVFPDINRKIPFACGATLSYNYIDLQLTNDTSQSYRINLWLDDTYLNGELLSDCPIDSKFEVFETDHQIKQQWWGGYTRHNKIWKRKTSLSSDQVEEELVSENHAIMMYNPLLTN